MADKKDVKKLVPAKADLSSPDVAGQKDQDKAPDGTAAGTGVHGLEARATVKSPKTAAHSRNQWIIIAIVVVICAGTGYGLGRLFARSDNTNIRQRQKSSSQTETTNTQLLTDTGAVDSQESWYYDFDPIVANLNEPSATRYIRAVLTLQISSELDPKKVSAFLEEKKPLLKNWLTIYLANQTIDDIRGDRNLRRIQSEILDAFNEKLFPDSKPKIRNVLFKEFAIQ